MEELQEKRNVVGINIIAGLQEDLMQGFLIALSIAGVLTASVGTYEAVQASNFWLIPIYWIGYFTALLFTFWKKPTYKIRAWILVGLLYLIGATDFIADGIGGSGRLFLLSLVFITGILLGRNESLLLVITNALTLIGFGIVFSTGAVSIPGDSRSSLLGTWIVSIVPITMLGLLIMVSLNFLIPQLVTALQNSQKLSFELQKNQAILTQQVEERTERITKRSTQLETITAIGQEFMSIQSLDLMLDRAVQLIHEKLGHDFVAIYLSDPNKQYGILRAASSEVGRNLLMSRYRVYIGETNFIGSVISRGNLRIQHYDEQNAEISDTPELTETRSQATLPLVVQNDVVGALDIQSSHIKMFSEEDVDILQVLADQLALSITNARIFEESQQSLETARRAYGQLSRRAWHELISREKFSKTYDPQQILHDDLESMSKIFNQGKMTLNENQLIIPLKERGQVIGMIRAQKAEEIINWSQEEINLLNSLTDQLEVALESARLYKDTQLLAEQERLVGEITAQIRQTLDIDTILKVAAQEIGEKLGLPKTEVWLTSNQHIDSELISNEDSNKIE